jgi:hypothetical protein
MKISLATTLLLLSSIQAVRFENNVEEVDIDLD